MTKKEKLCVTGIIINPFIVLFGVSFLQNLQFNKNLILILKIYTFHYVLFVLITMIFYYIFKYLWKAYCISTILIFIFYSASYYKLKLTGIPLTPTDFTFISSLKDILNFVTFGVDLNLFICLLFLCLSLVLMHLCLKVLEKYVDRLIIKNFQIFVCSLILLFTCFLSPVGKYVICKFLDIKNEDFTINENQLYGKYGDLVGFYILSQDYKNNQTNINTGKEADYVFDKENLEKQYSQKKMEEVLKEIKKSTSNISHSSNITQSPNVIVIMSEAFWDPNRLENIKFSSEPIPNYKKLSKTNIFGNILTPVIGGVTSNVEYEFLVGSSIYFVDGMDVPYEYYNKYIPDKDDRAVPWQFKNNGYKTIAVHPFNKFFYNRDLIYPRLGFDEFISLSDMKNADKKGKYVSDEYFVNTIIKTIEKTDEPVFLFGISMENHYPYQANKFLEIDITSQNNPNYQISTADLNSYVQGVHDADKSLGTLIDYLENQKKPTLVFFFGDHLPLIGLNPMDFYYKSGFTSSKSIAGWNDEDIKKMYSTPYLLWANYELPEIKFNNFSPIYIGPILMELANVNKNIYSNYLFEMQKHVPVLHREIDIDKNNGESKKWIDSFFYTQYDSLKYENHNGNEYIKNQLSKTMENKR